MTKKSRGSWRKSKTASIQSNQNRSSKPSAEKKDNKNQKNRRGYEPNKGRTEIQQPKTVKFSNTLKIYALGGLEEVGRNMTVFEYGQDIIILDIGNQFPEEDMHGIDYIIPNISSLRSKKKNIRGVVITHGH